MHLTLVPAYGRDYKSKAEVLADLNANKDFEAVGVAGNGYTNLSDLRQKNVTSVNIRYKQLRSVMVVKIPASDIVK